jgi:NFACT protein RNA binding domain
LATRKYQVQVTKSQVASKIRLSSQLPEDVWFHVDNLSLAHVYLRMKQDMTLDDLSDDVLIDCASLVKANSIQGCKQNSVYVVYTRWKNLKKTSDMVDGQVGFHRPDNVRRMNIGKNQPIVREIEKSKVECVITLIHVSFT